MKQKPKLRLLRRLRSRIIRMRHIRGHGVHSPYVYSIVREVFMRRTLIVGTETRLLDEMQELAIGRRVAIELHNIYMHCDYKSYLIDPTPEKMQDKKVDFVLCTNKLPTNNIKQIYSQSLSLGTTIVIELSHRDIEREDIISQIITKHQSTTIDKGSYIIIFNNHLPKQHFQL